MSTAKQQLEQIELIGPNAILVNGELPDLDELYKLYVYASKVEWTKHRYVEDVTLQDFVEGKLFEAAESYFLQGLETESREAAEEIRRKFNYKKDDSFKSIRDELDKRIKHLATEELIEKYTTLLEHGFVGIAQRLLGLTIFKSENVLELTPKHGRSVGNDIYDLRAVDTKLISEKALELKAKGKDLCREHFCSRKLHGERITRMLVMYKDNCNAVFDPINLQVFLAWLARELCRLNHVHSVTSAENVELAKMQKQFPEASWQQHYIMAEVRLFDEHGNDVDLNTLKNADVYRADSVWERLIERIENGQLDRWFV